MGSRPPGYLPAQECLLVCPPFSFWKGCSELGPPKDRKGAFCAACKGLFCLQQGTLRDLPSESVLLEQKKPLHQNLLFIFLALRLLSCIINEAFTN